MNIESRRIGIDSYAKKHMAARLVSQTADEIGFPQKVCQELALVASELSSNLIKHAGGGEILVQPVIEGSRHGIQIVSTDGGKGIADPEKAIADGYSTSQSLGYGLGTVNRLMDELSIEPLKGGRGGTIIICRRWLKPDCCNGSQSPLELGGATRPMPSMKLNGDAYLSCRWEQSTLLAVIDGVGHGQFANRAASRAYHYIENHYDQPLDKLFLGVSRECRITRGVVMALARFDWEPLRLTFASVGNITAKVFGAKLSLPIRRGIVGLNAPKPLISQHDFKPGTMLIMHSDGISSNWALDDFPGLQEMAAQDIAQVLMGKLSRENDDATVAVVKCPPR